MTGRPSGEQYMRSLERFGMKPGLERIHRLLEALGNPHRRVRTIHVAGSNGKGSTAAFIAAALQYAGLRVGLFTSPHLQRYNERIQIDGQPITDSALHSLVSLIDGHVRDLEPEIGSATEFEVGTALAFEHFARERVDVAVIETGLGGRLDSTNVVDPLLSVITPIALDHTETLGSTLAAIAREKAGIMKPGRPVVLAPQSAEALDVLLSRAEEVASPAIVVQPAGQGGGGVRTHRYTPGKWGRDGGTVYMEYADGENAEYRVGMLGGHQLQNGAVAAATLRELLRTFPQLTDDAVERALRSTVVPGRLEIVNDRPLVLLDGAHNPLGAAQLARALAHAFSGRRITLVCGISKDKPAPAILQQLLPCVDQVIATEPTSTRVGCWSSADLVALVAEQGYRKAIAIPQVLSALHHAVAHTHVDSVICVTGSLYLVGEARSLWVPGNRP